MKLFNGLKKIYSDDLIGTSAIIFLSSVMGNALNLVFWFYMVRRLTTIDYGTLNSLFSLMMILGLPSGAAVTVITKFIAQLEGQGDYGKMHFFLFHLGKRIIILAVILLFLFTLFSYPIASFMNISSISLIMITGACLFFSVLTPIPAGTLTGLQLFLAGAVIGIAVGVVKLISSVGLVALGLGAMGAMVGVMISIVLNIILMTSRMPKAILISQRRTGNNPSIKFISVYSYFIPVSVSILCFMVLTNIDIIMVKHYFSPLQAGYYSVAQIIGKIVLFLPAAISTVMFPKITNSYSQNEDTLHILKKSLLLVGVLCSVATVISTIFPTFILKILTGKVVLECVPLARIFALAMTFFALIQIVGTYHLSTHNFKFIYIMAFFTVLQIVLITLFHKDLMSILYILLFISTLLFFTGIKMVKLKR